MAFDARQQVQIWKLDNCPVTNLLAEISTNVALKPQLTNQQTIKIKF